MKNARMISRQSSHASRSMPLRRRTFCLCALNVPLGHALHFGDNVGLQEKVQYCVDSGFKVGDDGIRKILMYPKDCATGCQR